MYNETQTLSSQVIVNTSNAGCDRIKQEMQILKDEMDSLLANLSEAESGLHTSLHSIEEFTVEHEKFVEWLTMAEDKVKASSRSTEYHAPAQVEANYEVRYNTTTKMKPQALWSVALHVPITLLTYTIIRIVCSESP